MPELSDPRSAARPRGGSVRTLRALLTAGGCCLAAAIAGAQTPEPGNEADGLVHASLTLEAQGVTVAFPPDLRAGHHEYRWLLSGTVGSRVRVGSLDAHRALRLGALEPDIDAIEAEIAAIVAARQAAAEAGEAEESDEDAEESGEESGASDEEMEPADPELWLVRDASGWQLEIHPTDAADVRSVPLSHRETAAEAPTFAASLHATGAEAGRLELRWGRHAWSADFRFEEIPQAPPRPRQSGRGTARVAEDSNDAIARGNLLSERNETALVLPNGAGITLVYWKSIDVEDEDYPNVAGARDGEVIEMIRAPVLRLKSDVPLRFGATDIPTGNLAPGFAGYYGIWLRNAGDGWRFVFNHEADSWGTQYDEAFDAAEFAVDYTRTAGSFRPLGATLVPTGPDQGRIVVHWGPHEWSADFVVSE
ncbi:MAG: DUF2911 domain-containing protein [Acidobacteria bacterium]|nr:DUF2911 domain-containing protein [Acidobacteriota bacterium]